MDIDAALSELLELSTQVEVVAVLEGDRVLGSAPAATGRREGLIAALPALLAAADALRPAAAPAVRIEVALPEGGLVVVRDGDRVAAALTPPAPVLPLVVYDLRTCLRRIQETAP